MPENETASLPPHSKLKGGRYVVEKMLGNGGFGITYRAADAHGNGLVTVKELFISGSQRRGSNVVPPSEYDRKAWSHKVDKYIEQARTIASLQHPGIVRIIDYFGENNTGYLVMKFIDGMTLKELVAERGGRLSESEALNYIYQAGDALAALHAAEVLHRDIRPSNIMCDRQGRVMLIDSGAARNFILDQTLTQTVIGTFDFTPPEQYRLRAHRSPASDIFSLAATCHYLIAGRPPNIDDRGMVLREELIRQSLFSVLVHALAEDPSARPQQTAGFISELKAVALSRSISPPPTLSPIPPTKLIPPTIDDGITYVEPAPMRAPTSPSPSAVPPSRPIPPSPNPYPVPSSRPSPVPPSRPIPSPNPYPMQDSQPGTTPSRPVPPSTPNLPKRTPPLIQQGTPATPPRISQPRHATQPQYRLVATPRRAKADQSLWILVIVGAVGILVAIICIILLLTVLK